MRISYWSSDVCSSDLHPKDAFALRLAHFNHFYAGESRKMRDSVARVLPDWNAADPDIGFLHGMYGFALEETGDYVRGERYGRMAVERNPADARSVPAVAHVMEMQGRHAAGIAWGRGGRSDRGGVGDGGGDPRRT